MSINTDNIDNDFIEKEKKLISEELENSGKPKEIAAKIAAGKLKKYKEENSLMTQNWVMDPKKKVKDVILEKTGSKIVIKDFIRLKIGE